MEYGFEKKSKEDTLILKGGKIRSNILDAFDITQNGIIFNATVELNNFPEELDILAARNNKLFNVLERDDSIMIFKSFFKLI